MATFTRKAIMQTFLHILKNKPLDRITVKDICEQCEINRNTFYYYFKDIYDVLEAIFEDEVRLVMDEAKEGVTFHDAYARVAALILNNREAIMHIYASEIGTCEKCIHCHDNMPDCIGGSFVICATAWT